jgi:hypothetical protein
MIGLIRVKLFQRSFNTECYSEFHKIWEHVFSISYHNSSAERIFPLVTAQWTDERNRFTTEAKSLFSCLPIYISPLEQPTLHRDIKPSRKYAASTVS